MHIVALVSGILGLLCLPLLTVAHSPAPLFLAAMLGLIAIVTGAMSRSQRAGKAGLTLGVVGVVGMGAFFFLFTARMSVSPPMPVSVPAEVPAGVTAR